MDDPQGNDDERRLSWNSHPSKEEVERLEARLRANPRNRHIRAALLNHAFHAQFLERRYRKKVREHVLWFIEFAPKDPMLDRHGFGGIDAVTDPSGYAAARELWLQHLERNPDDVALLLNAAHMFALTEKDRARALLERAEKLDSSNAELSMRLGRHINLMAKRRDRSIDPTLAREALAAFERALASAGSGDGLPVALEHAAKAALDAEEPAVARRYAVKLLHLQDTAELGWMDGNAIYTGHSVLGAIALSEGDFDAAERELLEAGRTTGSPQLNSFGPELDLADALLQHGRTDAVLEFLNLCKRFWKEDRLQPWIDQIRRGERPRLDRFPSSFGEG